MHAGTEHLLRPLRSWWSGVAGAWQVLMVVVASFSGGLLAWDQLALSAVTVGTNISGFEEIVDGSRVRFVLIDGTELSTSTVVRWLVVHVLVGVVACAGPIVVLMRLNRSRPDDAAS